MAYDIVFWVVEADQLIFRFWPLEYHRPFWETGELQKSRRNLRIHTDWIFLPAKQPKRTKERSVSFWLEKRTEQGCGYWCRFYTILTEREELKESQRTNFDALLLSRCILLPYVKQISTNFDEIKWTFTDLKLLRLMKVGILSKPVWGGWFLVTWKVLNLNESLKLAQASRDF